MVSVDFEYDQPIPGTSWSLFFTSLGKYASAFGLHMGEERKILPNEARILIDCLDATRRLVLEDAEARQLILGNPNWATFDSLCVLVVSPVPTQLKASLFGVLDALCQTPDVVLRVWQHLEGSHIINPEGGIAFEFHNIEVKNASYPMTIAFLRMLCTMLKFGTPDGLDLRRYLDFVVGTCLIRARHLPCRNIRDQWTILSLGLNFVALLLEEFNPQEPYSLPVSASGSTSTGGQMTAGFTGAGMATTSQFGHGPGLGTSSIYSMHDSAMDGSSMGGAGSGGSPQGSSTASGARAPVPAGWNGLYHPAVYLLASILCGSPLLGEILTVIKSGKELVDSKPPVDFYAGIAHSALRCLLSTLQRQDAIHEILSRDSQLLGSDFLGRRPSWLEMLLLLDGPTSLIQTALFVGCQKSLPCALTAVQVFSRLALSPRMRYKSGSGNRLVNIISTSLLAADIMDAFKLRLSAEVAPVYDDRPGRCTPSALRIEILSLLSTSIRQTPFPSIGHFLLGFDIANPMSATVFQDAQSLQKRSSCLHAIVALLDQALNSCGNLQPLLAFKCYSLLLQLLSNRDSRLRVSSFLRSSLDGFVLRHLSRMPFAPPQEIVSSNQGLGVYLDTISVLLRICSIELHITSTHGPRDANEALIDALFDSAPVDNSDSSALDGVPGARHVLGPRFGLGSLDYLFADHLSHIILSITAAIISVESTVAFRGTLFSALSALIRFVSIDDLGLFCHEGMSLFNCLARDCLSAPPIQRIQALSALNVLISSAAKSSTFAQYLPHFGLPQLIHSLQEDDALISEAIVSGSDSLLNMILLQEVRLSLFIRLCSIPSGALFLFEHRLLDVLTFCQYFQNRPTEQESVAGRDASRDLSQSDRYHFTFKPVLELVCCMLLTCRSNLLVARRVAAFVAAHRELIMMILHDYSSFLSNPSASGRTVSLFDLEEVHLIIRILVGLSRHFSSLQSEFKFERFEKLIGNIIEGHAKHPDIQRLFGVGLANASAPDGGDALGVGGADQLAGSGVSSSPGSAMLQRAKAGIFPSRFSSFRSFGRGTGAGAASPSGASPNRGDSPGAPASSFSQRSPSELGHAILVACLTYVGHRLPDASSATSGGLSPSGRPGAAEPSPVLAGSPQLSLAGLGLAALQDLPASDVASLQFILPAPASGTDATGPGAAPAAGSGVASAAVPSGPSGGSGGAAGVPGSSGAAGAGVGGASTPGNVSSPPGGSQLFGSGSLGPAGASAGGGSGGPATSAGPAGSPATGSANTKPSIDALFASTIREAATGQGPLRDAPYYSYRSGSSSVSGNPAIGVRHLPAFADARSVMLVIGAVAPQLARQLVDLFLNSASQTRHFQSQYSQYFPLASLSTLGSTLAGGAPVAGGLRDAPLSLSSL
ncbi:hypothetical protein H696_00690 [Fonticula alba]|uniref:Uncharacterized protein n=1 Tax=Fonticula alba TaxID=691883 RepID=A0A058ZFL2_FONAL|nr:hypothetical protein H696_00690 [Fonticula alba]KCV73144.1 hypothetical protein H696_00690 [Fonticula alba]|eukprot:XP_009492845.1 hypothetical protein H696_00690 [Fonticula alba]